ncbi:hypothetical protein R2E40_15690 [Aeromonas sp. CD]|uniref:hypothetical protein n=1 Tax=Aeromonas sp. CD TaxID=3080830 RepID=UPI002966A07C|nr:hypothetical protein [Aeromonas sp. CD]WOX51235.1 hypothetical protein R2E40_15690 [Aeromonas sp. CD]
MALPVPPEATGLIIAPGQWTRGGTLIRASWLPMMFACVIAIPAAGLLVGQLLAQVPDAQ